jgi:hypothetical protein
MALIYIAHNKRLSQDSAHAAHALFSVVPHMAVTIVSELSNQHFQTHRIASALPQS